MTKELLQQALKKAYQLGQTYWQQADSEYDSEHRKSDVTAATFKQLVIDIEAAIAQPVQPANSTPLLKVGDSSFEEWYQTYQRQGISKQVARDAYAAGMGDPLVTYAQPVQLADELAAIASKGAL